LIGNSHKSLVNSLQQHQKLFMTTTVLLLIDFQNDYYPNHTDKKYALSGTEVGADNAAQLLTKFCKQELPIIHVRHKFPTDDTPFSASGSVGAQIHNSVLPITREAVILKHQINNLQSNRNQTRH
jgi:nicotinamidase-related amidase